MLACTASRPLLASGGLVCVQRSGTDLSARKTLSRRRREREGGRRVAQELGTGLHRVRCSRRTAGCTCDGLCLKAGASVVHVGIAPQRRRGGAGGRGNWRAGWLVMVDMVRGMN